MADIRVGHVDELVSRLIAAYGKCRNLQPDVPLEARFVTEREPPDLRVEAVDADHQVEGARPSPLEVNADVTTSVFDLGDAVVEDRIHVSAQRLEDHIILVMKRKPAVRSRSASSRSNAGLQRRATTFRLEPRLQRGLELLSDIRRAPLNRLVNEAVDNYLDVQAARLETDLEATLQREKQLAFGLADALISRLSRLDGIVVRPTSSVVRFSETDVTPVMAGTALRVALVLCGSVRRHRDITRCSVQLVDVETEASVWAGQFDESASDIFAMEDAIAARVTPLLVDELARRETDSAARGTDNTEAYILAQRGRYWLAKRHVSESSREAVECFKAAVVLDPRFAAAYAGLANAYLVSTIPSFTTFLKPPRTMIPLAREAAEEALRLVPDLSEAHAVLAHIAFGYDWNWPAAKATFRHALQLDPRNVFCRQSFAIGLCCAGDFDAALHQLELARELDPGSMAVRTNIGFVFHCWRRPDQAIAEMEACLALEPSFPYARYRYALALEARGRLDDALTQFVLLKDTPGAEVQGLVGTACGLALAGRGMEAQTHIDQLLALSERRYVSAYFFAEIFASLGEVAQSIAWLQNAYDERALVMPSLRNNPRFDRLRSNPRFKSLEREVGFWSLPDA